MTNRPISASFLYDRAELLDVAETIGVVSMAARVLPVIEAVTIAHAADPVALAGGLTVVAWRCAALRCDDCLRRPRMASAGPGCRHARRSCAASIPLRVASVSTGAVILGAAGPLDRRAVATRRRSFRDRWPLTEAGRRGRLTRSAGAI